MKVIDIRRQGGKMPKKVHIDNIIRIQSDSRMLTLFCNKNKKVISYMPLKDLVNVLPDYFLQYRRGCYVNAHYVEMVIKPIREIKLSTGEIIKSTRNYIYELQESDYLKSKFI